MPQQEPWDGRLVGVDDRGRDSRRHIIDLSVGEWIQVLLRFWAAQAIIGAAVAILAWGLATILTR